MSFGLAFCSQCNKQILKDIRHIYENKKLQYNNYCSVDCLRLSRDKRVFVICENSSCKRRFQRKFSSISPHNYCSLSCAVSVNNKLSPKRIARKKTCPICLETFITNEKYCSTICKYNAQKLSPDLLIFQIKSFYESNKRIPLKREFHHTKAARNAFGSWNKAIVAAGFTPNSVRFANRWKATDGHICDSLAEKIIDDWFSTKKITHRIHVPYDFRHMSADFKVNETFIEFFGLYGQHKRYDDLVDVKRKLWKKNKLKVVEIYPHDLFPINKLDSILNSKVLGFYG